MPQYQNEMHRHPAPGDDRPAPVVEPISNSGEIRMLLKIALPLTAAYIAEMAMYLTTKLVVGRLGYHELASVGLVSGLAFELIFILVGLLSIVGVLAAEAHGAGRNADAGQAARQGFIVATAIGIPATALIWNFGAVLPYLGQDESVGEIAAPYLRGLSGFVLPTLWFMVLRNFVAALARTGAVMVITVAAVGLNYLLTVGFVLGRFGLPELGVLGAGLATSIVGWFMLAALAVYAFRTSFYRGYGLFRGRLRFDRSVCAEILRLGIPISGLVILESGLFAGVAILSGIISIEALASYEIISSWIGMVFMFGMGLAEGTMVRVAFWYGRRDAYSARRAGILGMVFGIAVTACFLFVPLGLPQIIVQLFLDADDPGFETVSALVTQLLQIAAIFQIFDVLQAVAARALRGVKDTYAPLWIAGFGYWVLGIGGGSILAFPMEMGVVGLWWGMALGLIVTGTLLAWRFVALSTRLQRTL